MFFSFVLMEEYLDVIFAGFISVVPLSVMVLIGALQNTLGKEMKTKDKAAVDILGTKLVKSTGVSVQTAKFAIFPVDHREDITGFLMTGFVVVCLV